MAAAIYGNHLWTMILYGLAVLLLVVIMVGLSSLLGQRHRERATGQPYESGIIATGSAQSRMNVKFYQVAVFFVIFDIESIFLFAWASVVREAGWPGYLEILFFIFLLAAALGYLWRQGALDWGTKADTVRRERRSS